ncbi:MAG: hypothetical protein JST48_14325 [Bacteroidetes bacterium]|nr:hypothetical protein [Bacteroidota bacterium]
MENFELIDDYLRGRLEGQDKQNFEQQMRADPTLQSEVTMQQMVIEGIKKARMAELKTMLSQVPVAGLTSVAGISASQVIIGAFTAGAVLTAALFYFKPSEEMPSNPVVKTEKTIVQNNKDKAPTTDSVYIEPIIKKKDSEVAPSKDIKSKVTSTKQIIPKLQVTDPTDEINNSSTANNNAISINKHEAISTSKIEVEVTDSNEYSFHYQFKQDKLILYGTFDKSLYEIIEVNGDVRSIFLFYKDAYYLINEKQSSIAPLLPIKDQQLIKKLKEYRK